MKTISESSLQMAAEPKRRAGDILLPSEIWTEILSRVPVKSILQCRSVSKPWYSLISCPNFITKYSTRNLNKNGNRVLLHTRDHKACLASFSSHDESFIESREHDDIPKTSFGPSQCFSPAFGIVGSCNGLVCLSKRKTRFGGFSNRQIWSGTCKIRLGRLPDVTTITFLIWNPTIRKIVELPSRTFCSEYGIRHGFGFDSKTGDYNVVFMVGANVCEVFDSREGVWRGISPPVHSCRVEQLELERHPAFYLHGAVHWNLWKNKILLSFDMSNECFREIKMSDCVEFDIFENTKWVRSVTFGGLVCVIVRNSNFYFIDTSESYSVWVMKEYGVQESWTEMSNIDLQSAQGLPSTRLLPRLFLLWKNGEILIAQDLEMDDDDDSGTKQNLVLYNTESRKCKRLFSTTKRISEICIYEESLALM